MPHEDFTSVLQVKTINAIVVVDHSDRGSDFLFVSNTPLEASELDDREYNQCDPVLQHCKHSTRPIVWNQNTYTEAGLGWRWEWQARFGFHSGVALALHLPQKRHFFFGIDCDQPLPSDSREVARMTAELSLFTVYAQDVALKVLLPPEPEVDPPKLTRRELEGLMWTMEGKTAWEVGKILSISEQTAVRHLVNAARKLDCINKHQAVVKAMRLGLIR
ncbi:helix-turn-helix transcriptional regulator [Piscinibacter terrae]|uniref:LuxR family transcriptional regulator n=1 Tax=Piscinibacter terrae TaxID=2496871 RepID=A0A3N7HQ10_9BURK|nr:autoinducer binding domain-containing protein [Albitalea terrae]RQP24297.1 LuxR family transcriptional regulator [Albitalea terrae]